MTQLLSISSRLHVCAKGPLDPNALLSSLSWKELSRHAAQRCEALAVGEDISEAKAHIMCDMSVPTVFEARMYRHAVTFMTVEATRKSLTLSKTLRIVR